MSGTPSKFAKISVGKRPDGESRQLSGSELAADYTKYLPLYRGPGMVFFRSLERFMQDKGLAEVEIDFNGSLFRITLAE